MIPYVGLGNRRYHSLQGREDGQLLAVGMPDEYFVEETEALEGAKPGFAARQVERRVVDRAHVAPEGIVERHDRIKWFCHFRSSKAHAFDTCTPRHLRPGQVCVRCKCVP